MTTKELKKKHSSRPERGTEIGSRVERTVAGGLGQPQDRGWWLAKLAVPYLHMDKLGGTTGEQNRPCYPAFQCGEIKPQNL